MTYSQKIARFMEVFSYIMLIPAAFGVLVGLITILFAPWFTLIIWVVAGFGVSLLVSYCKHSRDLLPVEKINRMWVGTIIYNGLPLLFSIYYFYYELTTETRAEDYGQNDNGIIFMIVLTTWWLTAALAAASAMYKNYKDDEIYL